MNKDNFKLNHFFDNALSQKDFDNAKRAYLKTLEGYKWEVKKVDSIYDLIDNIKRTPQETGPYQNISVFEALNRIGSDLVLLSGATKLFKEGIGARIPISIHLKMGTTQGFDFKVCFDDEYVIYGEAFNAAKSFCKQKMRQAIHKLIDHNPDKTATEGIVFINKDVSEIIAAYKNEKELISDIKIHRVFCEPIKPIDERNAYV